MFFLVVRKKCVFCSGFERILTVFSGREKRVGIIFWIREKSGLLFSGREKRVGTFFWIEKKVAVPFLGARKKWVLFSGFEQKVAVFPLGARENNWVFVRIIEWNVVAFG